MTTLEDLVFAPTDEMREVKAAFWAKIEDKPHVNVDELTLVAVQYEVPDSRLREWWHLDGFKEWFANKDEVRQRMEYLISLGLDAVQDLMQSRDSKVAGAQVKALEMLCRLTNREPARVKEIKFIDKEVQDMTQGELEEFIAKNAKLLDKSKDEKVPEKQAKEEEIQ
jgi:hypothetical protein